MEFFVRHVSEITGVKRLRLHQWIERGFIQPSIQSGQKSGTPNIFNKSDLYKIELFKKLTESGFSRNLAASYLSYFTDPKFSDEDVFSRPLIKYLVFFKEDGEMVDYMTISDSIYENQLMIKVQERNFDDIYFINILKIKEKIDSEIEILKI